MKKQLLAVAIALTLCGSGCTGYQVASNTRTIFNEYHRAHVRETMPTTKSIDTLITVRVRAFGNQEERVRVWCETYPVFCKPPYTIPGEGGVSVSSTPPEIWVDLRENEYGLVTNDLILGHELRHTIKLMVPGVSDPDKQ